MRFAFLMVVTASFVAGMPGRDASGVGLRSASAQWPKLTHLADGSTVRVTKNGAVVVRSRNGQILSVSQCESGAVYEKWVKFMSVFQGAMEEGDRGAVVDRIRYPLRWGGTNIESRRELLRRYGAVFAPPVLRAVVAADPRALFCQNISEVMLGSGVIWGDDFGGRLAIVTVNRP
jgi:hypothetical protein